MSPHLDWSRIERLFDEGLEVPAAERAAWLRAQCGDDAALHDRVARMFRAHDGPGFLDHPLTSRPHVDVRAEFDAALGDRYTIESTLGEGGMAIVFRAHERKHDRPVVLKVLQPQVSALLGEQQFRDEVRIAAKLSHPHILALIDSGALGALYYYVMPYVGGESMRERLRRDGARPLGEAVAVLRSVADALAHAHAAGIVHRDLKPDNVLFVDGHAFLIDFGVAKIQTEVRTAEYAVRPPVGTPGYMAPEQAAGQPVDHRSDLYAWGLLARELLTGARQPSAPLATLRPDAPRSFVTLIEACLAEDPSERPQSARALVAALDALAPASAKRSRWPLVAAAAAVIVLGATWPRWSSVLPPMQGIAGPVAVLPLTNETADSSLNSWGRLAGDWITQGMHEAAIMPVVPWPTMVITAEGAAALGGDPIAMVRRQTGAGTVITGSYYRTGDSLRFQASVTDARSGRLIAAIPPLMVALDSASAAVRELRDRVMGAVGVASDERVLSGSGSTPPTWEAFRLFDEGIRLSNANKYEDASRAMEQAWLRDTSFTPALIYAGMAAFNDGVIPRAESLLAKGLERRGSLSSYHVALAEGTQAYARDDRLRAIEKLRRANALAPGSRAAYSLAYVLLQFNRAPEALTVLGSLDPDHGAMKGWPSYWTQRASAAHVAGQHEDELRFAQEMRRRFPTQRSAWVLEARALAALGDVTALEALLTEAEALNPDTYWSQGAMRTTIAEEYLTHETGDHVAAAREAVRWLEARLKVKPLDRDHRDWLWSAYMFLGDQPRARALLDSINVADPGRIRNIGNLARFAALQGDSARADSLLATAPTNNAGELLLFRARVAAILGRRDEAIARLGEALRTGVLGWHWRRDETHRDFGRYALDMGYKRVIVPIPFAK
ncbi:MAG: protein kinase [Gemmatimonadaceae bacterium]|nr:protein kinase [Gemmatimonadaceae bacterium]